METPRHEYEDKLHQFFEYQRHIEQEGSHSLDIDQYTRYWFDLMRSEKALFPLPQVWLKNEKMHHLWQVSLIIRRWFRHDFGFRLYSRYGFFTDHVMNGLVNEYAYSVAYRQIQYQIREAVKSIGCLTISTDGQYLFTANQYFTVWDLSTNRIIHSNMTKSGERGIKIRCLDYKLGRLACGNDNWTLTVWDAYRLKRDQIFFGHTGPVCSVCFHDNGDLLISGSTDTSIRLWSVKKCHCLSVLDGHGSTVYSALFFGNNKLNSTVISGSSDGSVRSWDTRDEAKCQTVTDGIRGPVVDVQINCDSSLLAAVSKEKYVTIFTMPGLERLNRIKVKSKLARFHPYIPFWMAIAEKDTHLVKFYNVISGSCIRRCDGHNTTDIHGLCFSPDGSNLISMSKDPSLAIWDLQKLLSRLKRDSV